MPAKQKILFVCTRNSCRSQMAEGLLSETASDAYDVFSAGMEPTEAHPLAIKVMDEIGVDISGHRSKSIREVPGWHVFGHVIFVCEEANKNCPNLYPNIGGKLVYWPFEDPEAFEGSIDERLAKFREVRDQIRDRITNWIEEMKSS
jgi:arsenate reductase (thioredoxin)